MPDNFDFSTPNPNEASRAGEQPIITILLIVLSIIFTTAYLTSTGMKGTAWYAVGHLGTTSVFEIWNGHYLPMLTSIFVHGDMIHITFNMYWLWLIGRSVENAINPLAYLGFIIAAGVIGSGVEMFISVNTGIGMSGVVYALFGLMWAGRGKYSEWRMIATRDNMKLFVVWGVICIIATYFHVMNVGNGAHFGGLLFGLCIGYIFVAPRKKNIMILPLLGVILIAVLGATFMPWTKQWKDRQAYTEWIEYIKVHPEADTGN